jgi:hypothetical protein
MLNASMFLLAIMVIWLGSHAWVAWSLLWPLQAGSRIRRTGGLLLLGSALFVPAVFMTRRMSLLHPHLSDVISWIAYIDMDIFMVLLPLVVVRDAARPVLWLWRRLQQSCGCGTPVRPDNPQRRSFLANSMNAGLLTLTGGMTLAGYRDARRLAPVKPVSIPAAGLHPDLHGFHIVQLSDIHLGATIKGDYLQGIVDRSNALQPDLVVITGDLVDGYTSALLDDVAPLKQLHAPYGSWFVTGNHEYYWGAADWCALLPTLGVRVLTNAHQVIRHGNARLLLAGATDFSAGAHLPAHASDPAGARRGAEGTDYSILLAHQPRSVPAALAANYDLQLSGHIHGGQFFPWNFVIGLVQPYRTGLHFVERRMWLYVSAGTGYWGPPSRLGVPSEITSIRLQRA